MSKRQPGFTLVELLVVIAIIGVLVALLLPAVQAAREAARRMSCSNNLKQLALALHTYHDSNRKFPPGNITEGGCCGTRSRVSWAISILPYIEQQALMDKYNHNVFNEHAANRVVRETILDSMLCPSDINTKRTDRPASGPGNRLQYAPGSYRAVSAQSNGRCWGDNHQIFSSGRYCWTNRGVLHHVGTRNVKPETFATISDGTNHQLLIGEYHTKTQNRRRTFWAYTYTSYNQSDVTINQPRIFIPDYQKCVSIGGVGGSNPCKRAFASFHPGSLQWALADGSVRGVSENTDVNILAALAAINDNVLVNLGD